MPMTIRAPVKRIEDIKLMNSISPLIIPVNIKKEFTVKNAKANTAMTKNILVAFGYQLVSNLSSILPFNLDWILVKLTGAKFTAGWSNLYSSSKRFVVNGKKTLGQFYLTGVSNDNHMIMTMSTVENDMAFCVFSDHRALPNPQQFVDILVRKNKENIKA